MMSERPHVLLITVDHWFGSLLGVNGHPTIQTPTLDQLASNGVRFTQSYSECPVCIPARRTLMTGTSPHTHGDRVFQPTLRMPKLPTLAGTFREAGYQAYAVGKLHVYPQRDRIGFDDVILAEEGRNQWDVVDDYERFLAECGHVGKQFAHGMSNNEYIWRPWHLTEDCHPTNWITWQMAQSIKRRDPTRPGLWYLSYIHPHPPLVPLQIYFDMYRDTDTEQPYIGEWASDRSNLPYTLRKLQGEAPSFKEEQIRAARRAFYALCTHIDHQLRLVIGTLHEQGLLENTVILFTSDHGDMLGNHYLWAKRLFYEASANVPMILVGTAGDERVSHHRTDNRLVGLQDVMPTLLDLCGIDIPSSVEGLSMVGERKRDWLYGEINEGADATRMIHDGQFKLIYYATGNRLQLFDLRKDPQELQDLSTSPRHAEMRGRLTKLLIEQLYGGDERWIQDGQLVGLPDRSYEPTPNRDLSLQRGIH